MSKKLTPNQILELSLITEDQVLPIKEIVAGQDEEDIDRFATGFSALDKSLDNGFKEGDLIIVSGISGQGKTTFAQTLTYNLIKQGVPCLWFSFEMLLIHLHRKFKAMGLTEDYIAYAPKKNTSGKLDWIKYKIEEAQIKYATKVVFIDMIDFLSPMDIRDKDTETLALKKIAEELKWLAVNSKIIIVTMAHITKLKENEEAGMQHIAWSSGIYQMADVVFMVSREKTKKQKQFGSVYDENEEDLYTNNGFIKVVKYREGSALKKIKVNFKDGKFFEITNQYDTDKDPTNGKLAGRADLA